jgi:hypothetical protein
MRQLLKSLALLLLLLTAQQGAVVHDLSHLAAGTSPVLKIDAGVADSACVLCPAFAQAGSPAFAHTFHFPSLSRAAVDLGSALPGAPIDAAIPRPRSRGPPV